MTEAARFRGLIRLDVQLCICVSRLIYVLVVCQCLMQSVVMPKVKCKSGELLNLNNTKLLLSCIFA